MLLSAQQFLKASLTVTISTCPLELPIIMTKAIKIMMPSTINIMVDMVNSTPFI